VLSGRTGGAGAASAFATKSRDGIDTSEMPNATAGLRGNGESCDVGDPGLASHAEVELAASAANWLKPRTENPQ
jgi:hypothetical protein